MEKGTYYHWDKSKQTNCIPQKQKPNQTNKTKKTKRGNISHYRNSMTTFGCSSSALKISAGNSLFTCSTILTTLPLLEAHLNAKHLSGIWKCWWVLGWQRKHQTNYRFRNRERIHQLQIAWFGHPAQNLRETDELFPEENRCRTCVFSHSVLLTLRIRN